MTTNEFLTRAQELYLDWTNNFLTVDKFAEHYNLPVALSQSIIDFGRKAHEHNVTNYKARTTAKVSELTKGQRFFHGQWYDFVSYDISNVYAKVNVTNGFDEREYSIILNPELIVRVPFIKS